MYTWHVHHSTSVSLITLLINISLASCRGGAVPAVMIISHSLGSNLVEGGSNTLYINCNYYSKVFNYAFSLQ